MAQQTEVGQECVEIGNCLTTVFISTVLEEPYISITMSGTIPSPTSPSMQHLLEILENNWLAERQRGLPGLMAKRQLRVVISANRDLTSEKTMKKAGDSAAD